MKLNLPEVKNRGGGKDNTISYLCYRGGHSKCMGRTCECDCHIGRNSFGELEGDKNV